MEFAVSMCNLGTSLATAASWIRGSNPTCVPDFQPPAVDVCAPTSSNRHVQGMSEGSQDALVGFPRSAVSSLWTYTPRQSRVASALLSQRMSLFIMTLDGRISKGMKSPEWGFNHIPSASEADVLPRGYHTSHVTSPGQITLTLELKDDKMAVSASGLGISEYHKLDIKLTTENGTWNGRPVPVGATDDLRALMYISNVNKITLTLELKDDKMAVSASGLGISEYHKLDIKLTTENGTWNGRPVPVGATDDLRALMYISNGNKLVYLSLDYCRQFRSCDDCISRNNMCQWCPAERACRGEETTVTQCKATESNTCPPRLNQVSGQWSLAGRHSVAKIRPTGMFTILTLDHLVEISHNKIKISVSQFSPLSVPTAGGSVLTLFGSHIGSEVDDMNRVTVTVCGQQCENVTKMNEKGDEIRCSIRPQCDDCPLACKVEVSVEKKDETYTLEGDIPLNYVAPQVTGFSPSHGPVSGHTLVQVTGQHLESGSDATVSVAGMGCEIINRGGPSVQCRLVGERGANPRCGPVKVSIDNFQTELTQTQFCLREDPEIRNITPTQAIQSGGITITMEGTNLGSANSAAMVLTLPDREGRENLVNT
ncbi:hypothetical protein EGW08_004664 [Elysia chlorotica]|uniref:IPT/TIG domain-containing protein n=1 Tax=Elysia chlorotica TaxID=188477 RepID=A0A433U1D4_ELYCH|nr:hypothetical protein EGW08_004664 [Elysia chlorotica]